MLTRIEFLKNSLLGLVATKFKFGEQKPDSEYFNPKTYYINGYRIIEWSVPVNSHCLIKLKDNNKQLYKYDTVEFCTFPNGNLDDEIKIQMKALDDHIAETNNRFAPVFTVSKEDFSIIAIKVPENGQIAAGFVDVKPENLLICRNYYYDNKGNLIKC